MDRNAFAHRDQRSAVTPAAQAGFTPSPMPRVGGFTLTEVIVVSLLSVIVAGGLLTALMSGRSSYLSSEGYLQVQQEARRAFDSVMRELRESGKITCGTAMSPGCTSATSQLNFQVAEDYDARTGITWGRETTCGSGNDYLHYALVTAGANTQLVRYCNGAAGGALNGSCVVPWCRVLANNVNPQTSGFIAVDTTGGTKPNMVTLNLEILSTNPALPGRILSSGVLTSQVRLRNSY